MREEGREIASEKLAHMYSWQLLLSMQSEYFPGGSIVAAAGTEADRLMIIVSGYIRSLI